MNRFYRQLTTNSPLSARDEFMEPAFTPLIVDASEDEVESSEPELYTPGELPRPRFVMLGQQGGRVFNVIFNFLQFPEYLLLLRRCVFLFGTGFEVVEGTIRKCIDSDSVIHNFSLKV